MEINDTLDTLLNLSVFAFIGAMLWLYLRPLAAPQKDRSGDQ